jgi:uncharacterized protein YndB with AHSA1/START domain
MAVRLDLRPPSEGQKVWALLIGVFVLLYVASCLLTNGYGAAFFSIPVFVGFVAGLLYPQGPFRASLYALITTLGLAIVTLREGVVCVLFSLPLLVPLLWLGSFAGSIVRRHVNTRRARNAGITLVILLGIGSQVWARMTDDPSRHPLHVAEAEIAIDAAPEAVFAAFTQGELRVESRWPWFIRIGLPMPERMNIERAGRGGRVRFDFSQGTAFARITTWKPGRELAYTVDRYQIQDLPFHITRLGRGPDYGFRSERIEDWLTIVDTSYTLTRSSDGRTVLRRRIRWQRHLAPDLYFGWLQQVVMERGQIRLLELIRNRVPNLRKTPAAGSAYTAVRGSVSGHALDADTRSARPAREAARADRRAHRLPLAAPLSLRAAAWSASRPR